MPYVAVHVGGVLQNSAPEPIFTAPQLVIQLNGIGQSLVSVPEQSSHSISESDDNLNNINEDEEGEENDLLDGVDHKYERGGSEDAENGPDWMFEAEEVTRSQLCLLLCTSPQASAALIYMTFLSAPSICGT